jgi:hypothetical protein
MLKESSSKKKVEMLMGWKVGDKVSSWAGKGKISFVRRSATGKAEKVKITKKDGSRTKFINVGDLKRRGK